MLFIGIKKIYVYNIVGVGCGGSGVVDGWDGLWLDDYHWVQCIGSNNNMSSLIFFTLARPHHHDTAAGWWRLFVHVFSFFSIQRTCSPQTHLQFSHCIVLQSTSWPKTSSYLHQDVDREQTKSQETPLMLTAQLPNVISFLTHIFTIKHSLTSRYLSSMASQIPWSIHKANHKGPNRIKAYPFSGSIFNLSHSYPNSHVQCTCLPDVLAAETSKLR